MYVIQLDERDDLMAFLKERGIQSGLHYPKAIHEQSAYQDRIRGCDSLPVTEKVYPQILSLPMYPELRDEEVERVCEALTDWANR